MSFWTNERVETLRILVVEKRMTSNQIAAYFGPPANANMIISACRNRGFELAKASLQAKAVGKREFDPADYNYEKVSDLHLKDLKKESERHGGANFGECII